MRARTLIQIGALGALTAYLNRDVPIVRRWLIAPAGVAITKLRDLATITTSRRSTAARTARRRIVQMDRLESGRSSIIDAERELLTVPGDPGEHRRRDQTAGVAAQAIAAAQVRERRSATGDIEEQ